MTCPVYVEVNQHMDSCSADTRPIPIYDHPAEAPCIHDAVPPTEDILVMMDERMAKATATMEADFSKVETKIHRFPLSLRGIGGDKDRYIVPSVVAIGPYHHGSPHLRKMEEVKLAAAYYLCRASGHSTAQVYEKVRSVAGAARGCYDADDPGVVGLRDDEFAAMMFLDGCFLVQYMVGEWGDEPVLLNSMMRSTGPIVLKDIFLLENQIPWLVLDALAEFMPVDVRRFVAWMGSKFLLTGKRSLGGDVVMSMTAEQYKPPHLVGLLWFTLVGCMPEQVKKQYVGFSPPISAAELAHMGVKLTPSTEASFGDMRVRRNLLFGQLCLSPLLLNDVTASWLVNITALETSTSGSNAKSDGYDVSSYLSVLAMLIDREDDVQQLRAKHLVYSTFSNMEALNFFKALGQNVRLGRRYFALLEEIDSYKHHSSLRIAIHQLLYNSVKGLKAMTIATLFTILGVLVTILQTLLENMKK